MVSSANPSSGTCECVVCRSTQSQKVASPPVLFHQRTFWYRRCTDCGSIFLDPIPDEATVLAMYPPTYQGEPQLADNGRFRRHVALLQRFLPTGARILDHGCGNGQLISLLLASGFQADGTEFNVAYLPTLAAAFPGSQFYPAQDLAALPEATYDCITLSNVLEHMADPGATLAVLKRALKPGGVILAEGPLEANRSLITMAVWANYAWKARKPNAVLTHAPYHFSFTTYQSQRDFFRRNQWQELHYEAAQSSWPFPNSWGEAVGLSGKLRYLIVVLSRIWRRLDPTVGNMFFYVGRA